MECHNVRQIGTPLWWGATTGFLNRFWFSDWKNWYDIPIYIHLSYIDNLISLIFTSYIHHMFTYIYIHMCIYVHHMFILLQHFCFIRFHIKLSLISVDDPGRSPKVAVETTRVFVWVYVIYIYIYIYAHIMFVYIYILYMCIKIDNTFIILYIL